MTHPITSEFESLKIAFRLPPSVKQTRQSAIEEEDEEVTIPFSDSQLKRLLNKAADQAIQKQAARSQAVSKTGVLPAHTGILPAIPGTSASPGIPNVLPVNPMASPMQKSATPVISNTTPAITIPTPQIPATYVVPGANTTFNVALVPNFGLNPDGTMDLASRITQREAAKPTLNVTGGHRH